MPQPVTPSQIDSELDPRRHWLLGLIFGGALALRLAYLWGQAQNNPLFADPFMDGRVHHDWARQLAAGEGLGNLPYFRAPLYYYLLGWLYKLAGPAVGVGRVAGAVLGAATCYLIGRLGVRVAGFRAGLIAGLIAAVYWPFIYFDGELLTVGLEVFLDVSLLLLLLRAARHSSLWLFLLAGAVCGLSALTRPNILAVAPGIAIWFWFVIPHQPRLKRWLATVAVTALGGALVVLPVTLRNYFVSGELVLIASQAGVNFYIGNNPESNGFVAVVPGTRGGWWDGYEDTHRIAAEALGRTPTETEVSRYWFNRAVEWIRSDPGAWLRLMLLKARLFWTPMEIPNNQPIWFFTRMSAVSALFWIGFPVVACLGAAGFVLHRSTGRAWALLLIFALIYMTTVVAFFCPARYRLPIVPVLIVSVAAGLAELPAWIRARRYGRLAIYAAVAGVVAVMLPFNLPREYEQFHAYNQGEGHKLIATHYSKLSDDDPQNLDLAIEHCRLALEYRPDDTQTRMLLARSLSQRPGRTGDAIKALRETVRREPFNQSAVITLANALGRAKEYRQAARHYRHALSLGPIPARVRYDFSVTLRRTGQYAEAIQLLQEGLAAHPRDARLNASLAWIRATAPADDLRDGPEALRLAELARKLTDQPHPTVLDTLAAACAEVGRFDDAARYARQAVELARRSKRVAQAKEIDARRRLYEKGLPYRAPHTETVPATQPN